MTNPNLAVGATAERTRLVTDAQVRAFAEATGDRNPVHLDEAFASGTIFGGRIAHGMLIAGFVSAALAEDLPGPGTIYLEQTVRFLRPVRIADVITVCLEVTELLPEKRRARIAIMCRNQHGEVVVEGEATVKLPS